MIPPEVVVWAADSLAKKIARKRIEQEERINRALIGQLREFVSANSGTAGREIILHFGRLYTAEKWRLCRSLTSRGAIRRGDREHLGSYPSRGGTHTGL